jgi:tRNA uridine 5-carbamoylmethylation protein Kti12
MPTPVKTEQEIENIIQIAKKADGPIPESEVISVLHEDDQTKKRLTKLLKNELKQRGVTFVYENNKIKFTYDENKPISKSLSEQPIVKKSLTKLFHNYILPSSFMDMYKCVKHNGIILVKGPPGCGKSTALERIFEKLNIPYTRIPMGNVDGTDLIGEIQLVNVENSDAVITKFIPGILTAAMQDGTAVICDELDQMNPEVAKILQRLLETDGQINIQTEKGPIVIKPKPGFRIVFTSNTDGYGDTTGSFNGTFQMNSSTMDRIHGNFNLDYNVSTEFKILRDDYKLPEDVLKMLFGKDLNPKDPKNLINHLREECRTNDAFSSAWVTTRMLINIGHYYKVYDNEDESGPTYSWHKTMAIFFVNVFPEMLQNDVKAAIARFCGEAFIPTIDQREILSHTKEINAKKLKPLADGFLPPAPGLD